MLTRRRSAWYGGGRRLRRGFFNQSNTAPCWQDQGGIRFMWRWAPATAALPPRGQGETPGRLGSLDCGHAREHTARGSKRSMFIGRRSEPDRVTRQRRRCAVRQSVTAG